MDTQEDKELKNIVSAMICGLYPEAMKKIDEAYSEISSSISNILKIHGFFDGVETDGMDKTLGKILMHAVHQGMADNLG